MQSRRQFLKTLAALGFVSGAGGIGACSYLIRSKEGRYHQRQEEPVPPVETFVRDYGPIDRTFLTQSKSVFSGDTSFAAHEALWQKQAFLEKAGGIPSEAQDADLVIVGGGMSGLFSAYLLREWNPIVLEQAPRFGGNAKGESWEGLDYSIGAAYFMEGDKTQGVGKLFAELGFYELALPVGENDSVYAGTKLIEDFWGGASDPSRKADFLRMAKHFSDVANNHNGKRYPELPPATDSMRRYVDELDRQSFYNYCLRAAGGKLHPHIATVLEHYCWSTLGSGMADTSAAVGLNSFAAEFGTVFAAPGGNAALAEAVLKRILRTVPQQNLHTNSLVVDVRAENDRTLVTYRERDGKLRALRAKACIMACPKFVVAKLLHEAEAERLEAIRKLRYNSYLVASICLNTKIEAAFYDAYLLKDGRVDVRRVEATSRQHKSTDLISNRFAYPNATKTVVNLFRALPWPGARGELLAENSFERFYQEFQQELEEEILPALKVEAKAVSELRLTRWAHPLPVASPGLIAGRTADRWQKPFRERIFFVEQDNWALPAIETCAAEALRWAPLVEKALRTGVNPAGHA